MFLIQKQVLFWMTLLGLDTTSAGQAQDSSNSQHKASTVVAASSQT
jgi:hypothetical protein